VTPPVPPPPAKTSAGGAPPRPRRLEDPFRDHEWDIETRCLQAHAEHAKSLTRLEVKFTVDGSGRVQRAEVRPASAESSPLGECVLGFARKTRFDRRLVQENLQPGQTQLVFSVPVRVRAQK
jgi:TonB family protein